MFNNQIMNVALEMAKEAFSNDEVPVGAVILDPVANRIISKSYNLVETKKDPTAHAEILAIQSACQFISSKALAGLDIYVTLQPCAMCMQAIIYGKIRRLYFGAYDHSIILNKLYNNHEVEIYGGIEEEKCKALLGEFFLTKRNAKS